MKKCIKKLESLKWIVVKSNRNISKSLSEKLKKIRHGSAQENIYYFLYSNTEDYNNIINLLKSYKKQKFEIVGFYDKQFGLTVNSWNGNTDSFCEKINNLPLRHRFSWFNGLERLSVTPITEKQFNNIVNIN